MGQLLSLPLGFLTSDDQHIIVHGPSINDKLPDDVLLHIFSHFGISTLVRLERVCRRWKGVLASQPSLWLDLYALQTNRMRVRTAEQEMLCYEKHLQRTGGRLDRFEFNLLHNRGRAMTDVEKRILVQIPRMDLRTLLIYVGEDKIGSLVDSEMLRDIEQQIVRAKKLEDLRLQIVGQVNGRPLHLDKVKTRQLCRLRRLIVNTCGYVPRFIQQPSCLPMFSALRFLCVELGALMDETQLSPFVTLLQQAKNTLEDVDLLLFAYMVTGRMPANTQGDPFQTTVIDLPRVRRLSIYTLFHPYTTDGIPPTFELRCPQLSECIFDAPQWLLTLSPLLSPSVKMLAITTRIINLDGSFEGLRKCTGLTDLQILYHPRPLGPIILDRLVDFLTESTFIPVQRFAVNVHCKAGFEVFTREPTVIPPTQVDVKKLIRLVQSRLSLVPIKSIVLEYCLTISEEELSYLQSLVDNVYLSRSDSRKIVGPKFPNLVWEFEERFQRVVWFEN